MKVTRCDDGTSELDFHNTNGPVIYLGRIQTMMLEKAVAEELVFAKPPMNGRLYCPSCERRTAFTLAQESGEMSATCIRCYDTFLVTHLGLMASGHPWCGTIASEAQDDPTT